MSKPNGYTADLEQMETDLQALIDAAERADFDRLYADSRYADLIDADRLAQAEAQELQTGTIDQDEFDPDDYPGESRYAAWMFDEPPIFDGAF